MTDPNNLILVVVVLAAIGIAYTLGKLVGYLDRIEEEERERY